MAFFVVIFYEYFLRSNKLITGAPWCCYFDERYCLTRFNASKVVVFLSELIGNDDTPAAAVDDDDDDDDDRVGEVVVVC